MWPLQLVFLLALGLGLLTLFKPKLLDPTHGDWTIGIILILIAAGSAVVLYLPRWWVAMKVPQLDDVANHLAGIAAQWPNNEPLARDRLDILVQQINAIRDAVTAIQAQLPAANQQTLGALLQAASAGVTAIQQQLPASGQATLRDQLPGIREGVEAIRGQMPVDQQPSIRDQLPTIQENVAAIRQQLPAANQPAVREQLGELLGVAGTIRQQLPPDGEPAIREQLTRIQACLDAIQEKLPG